MLRLDWNMVITIVNLIVLCLLLKKFLIGPVTAIMEQRAALIEQQLADAKNDKQAAGDLKASYEEKLKTSDAESVRIVEESRASARAEYDRIVAEADRKAARILEDSEKGRRAGAGKDPGGSPHADRWPCDGRRRKGLKREQRGRSELAALRPISGESRCDG